MEQSQFSLSWDAHRRNICSGLSSLQQSELSNEAFIQNSEFVDMTLAADGHMVKVHQVIVALASPYIKELISSAQCPHPIVFLNKISYATLSALLEYIYTGEVLVDVEHLNELIEAGKELRIKGLEDMVLQQGLGLQNKTYKRDDKALASSDENIYFEVTNPKVDMQSTYITPDVINPDGVASMEGLESLDEEMQEESEAVHKAEIADDGETPENASSSSVMQYTTSNQGSIQMILNRYMYFLKHTNKDQTRQWRCVDYLNTLRCPALVVTKGDMVLQRSQSHVHPFHDRRILKKVQENAVFTAIQEAVKQGDLCKTTKASNTSSNVSIASSNNYTVIVQADAEE